MGILFEKKTFILSAAAAITGSVLMIIFSDTAVLSAKKGIELWASSVLPAMLPFFICVNYMTGIGLIELLPPGIFPFAMSVLSGYPMGAKVVGDMCRSGMIDRREAMRLMSYCSTSGPVFMIGAVGAGMMGSQPAGIVIALSHYGGAIANGLLFSAVFKGDMKKVRSRNKLDGCNIMEVFTGSIYAAFRSMAVILAYIIIFMFIMELLDKSGVFDAFQTEIFSVLMKGAVEMTVGCDAAAGAGLGIYAESTLAAMILSWGGLSIMGQSMSMLSGTGVTVKYLALTKLTHCIFAGIISLFIGSVML